MKFRFFLFISLFLQGLSLHAQISHDYKSDIDKLSKEFHKDRRDLLRATLPQNSCAIFFAGPERNRSADIDYEFHQDPDFYYLTGLLEPNSLLLIWKDSRTIKGSNTNELLFIRPQDPDKELWTGRRLGIEGAITSLGIQTVYSSEEFESMNELFDGLDKILYKGFPKGVVNDRFNNADLSDLLETFKLKSNYPSQIHDDYLLGKALRSLREIKTPEEISLMQKAADISVKAHLEMMKGLSPGMTEFQVEAIGEYYFKINGAADPAYPSICGAAENSCILHYISNRRQLNSGDLLLLDMGAEYQGYAADITRTLPVNGKYTELQKKIYDLVLTAQKAAINACLPGKKFTDPDLVAKKILKEGLVEMKIIEDPDQLSLYYPHGTSHFLGLDVHDVGMPGLLKPGMVLTVEPGLYFPTGSPCNPELWNIGIRIEDDILITIDGNINLSEALPRETSEIEAIMQEMPFFKQN